MRRRFPSPEPTRRPRSQRRTWGPVRSRDFRVAAAAAAATSAGGRAPWRASRAPATGRSAPCRRTAARRRASVACGLAVLDRGEVELDVRMLAGRAGTRSCFSGTTSRTSRDPPELRARAEARPVRALEVPVGAGCERTPHVGAASTRPGHQSGQRAGSASTAQTSSTGAGERPPSLVPRQGTPVRRASARARPSARRRRAARFACASGRPASSRRGSGGRRARRSAAGG